jgi:hypothetical protein
MSDSPGLSAVSTVSPLSDAIEAAALAAALSALRAPLAAARLLLRGRCPFRGEWERIPFFFGERMLQKSEGPFQKKNTS